MSLLTKEITFCSGVSQNIVDKDFKDQICNKLKNYNCNILCKHYNKFEDPKTQEILNKIPHFVCMRSHGNPYFLLLTKYFNRNICIFIDKKIQSGYTQPRMISVPFCFNDSLFEDTILDGEMVKDNNCEWVYLINDVYIFSGEPLYEKKLQDRLSIIDDIMLSNYTASLAQPCAIQIKKYFKIQDIKIMLNDFYASLPYKSRGIIFKPFYARFKDTLIEISDFKPLTQTFNDIKPTENTKAMIQRDNDPDCYKVIISGKLSGHLYIKNIDESIYLYKLFIVAPAGKCIPMQVEWNSKFEKFSIVQETA
jgi:hypothetical protein